MPAVASSDIKGPFPNGKVKGDSMSSQNNEGGTSNITKEGKHDVCKLPKKRKFDLTEIEKSEGLATQSRNDLTSRIETVHHAPRSNDHHVIRSSSSTEERFYATYEQDGKPQDLRLVQSSAKSKTVEQNCNPIDMSNVLSRQHGTQAASNFHNACFNSHSIDANSAYDLSVTNTDRPSTTSTKTKSVSHSVKFDMVSSSGLHTVATISPSNAVVYASPTFSHTNSQYILKAPHKGPETVVVLSSGDQPISKSFGAVRISEVARPISNEQFSRPSDTQIVSQHTQQPPSNVPKSRPNQYLDGRLYYTEKHNEFPRHQVNPDFNNHQAVATDAQGTKLLTYSTNANHARPQRFPVQTSQHQSLNNIHKNGPNQQPTYIQMPVHTTPQAENGIHVSNPHRLVVSSNHIKQYSQSPVQNESPVAIQQNASNFAQSVSPMFNAGVKESVVNKIYHKNMSDATAQASPAYSQSPNELKEARNVNESMISQSHYTRAPIDLNEWKGHRVLVKSGAYYHPAFVRGIHSENELSVSMDHEPNREVIYGNIFNNRFDVISDAAPSAGILAEDTKVAVRVDKNQNLYVEGSISRQKRTYTGIVKYLVKIVSNGQIKSEQWLTRPHIRLLQPPWWEDLEMMFPNRINPPNKTAAVNVQESTPVARPPYNNIPDDTYGAITPPNHLAATSSVALTPLSGQSGSGGGFSSSSEELQRRRQIDDYDSDDDLGREDISFASESGTGKLL